MPRELAISFAQQPRRTSALTVIYVAEDKSPEGRAGEIWARTGLDFQRIAASAGFGGRPGNALDIIAPQGLESDRLLVLGRGGQGDALSDTAWCDRGGSLWARIEATRAATVTVVLDEPKLSARGVAELAAGMRLRHYRFDKYRTASGDARSAGPETVEVTISAGRLEGVDAAIADRDAVVEGTLLARTLVNEPPNVLGPVEFASQANGLADLGVAIEVLTPEDMDKLGMGALLAVAKGSERPARLVVMQWNGARKGDAPVAFVGKGVVFDTGGISIKPGASMQDMKGDMGGAAAVTGLMKALALRKARVNAVGVIGLVENMPDGKAYRPGDILTAMSGKTIEVINTDAEGRLVLADALWYTQDRFKPRAMIDLATLTGAMLVALGHDHAGLFSNDDTLAGQLQAAGMASGEKVWRLPMGPAYEKLIESRFADIKNAGGRPAGSISAAQFLQHFTNGVPWGHIDIAGTGFGAPNSEINTSWSSGFGVALLDRFVRETCENREG
ncbi:leucyl aminopeptidase [Pelagibacterium montanilacus]|uniref:leucyl aminopeptidase n=1 Tax=Pelagibacterium montanilacus TaxID=2185280 RepID=UPI000F8CE776|nr:leucyl aminopeptidase [Pelagibacterium montanilacus]